MKQKDFMLLAIVVIVSAIFSLIISNLLFATPADRQQQVTIVNPINSTFTPPSNTYFNSSSIDPTQTVQVNINSNQTPFGTSSTGN